MLAVLLKKDFFYLFDIHNRYRELSRWCMENWIWPVQSSVVDWVVFPHFSIACPDSVPLFCKPLPQVWNCSCCNSKLLTNVLAYHTGVKPEDNILCMPVSPGQDSNSFLHHGHYRQTSQMLILVPCNRLVGQFYQQQQHSWEVISLGPIKNPFIEIKPNVLSLRGSY